MGAGDALWTSDDPEAWLAALAAYDAVVAAQGRPNLVDHDRWYRLALPAYLAERDPPYLTLDDLVRVVRWKMARGEWRARNLALVQSNEPDSVEWHTREAFALEPDPAKPISLLSKLAGVGPATASAVLAAHAPDVYPFFDELVALQIPGLGAVKFTARYYAAYAERLRERAAALAERAGPGTTPTGGWTPHACDLALWAHAGGKAGATAP